jgi:hypothetical protein
MAVLWTSGEVQVDVADSFRLARKEVDTLVNETVKGVDYGDGLEEWALIFIIRAEDHSDYDEVKKYRKKTREFEFRLKIPHGAFKIADATGQRRLIAESVRRSIAEMDKLRASNVDIERLRKDVVAALVAKGWLDAVQ